MASHMFIINFLNETLSSSETTTTTASNLTSNSTYSIQHGENPSLLYVIFVSIVLSAIDLTTLIGNLLVVIAVLTTKSLHTVTNSFIMSLAVADMLVAVLVMPLSIYMVIYNNWKFGFSTCDLWIGSDVMLCTASILNLCCISLDRYFAITRPLSYSRRRSPKLARSMIALVWIGSVLISCPPVFGWGDKNRDENTCTLNVLLSYRIYSSMGSFFVPCVIMVFVYIRIFKVIHDREKYLMSNSSHGTTFSMPEKKKSKNKDSKTQKPNSPQQLANQTTANFKLFGCLQKNTTNNNEQPIEFGLDHATSTNFTLYKTNNNHVFQKEERNSEREKQLYSSYNEIETKLKREIMNQQAYKRNHNDSLVATISKTATNKDHTNCSFFCFNNSRNKFVFNKYRSNNSEGNSEVYFKNGKNFELSRLRPNLEKISNEEPLVFKDNNKKLNHADDGCFMKKLSKSNNKNSMDYSSNVGLKLSKVNSSSSLRFYSSSLANKQTSFATNNASRKPSRKYIDRFRRYFRSKSLTTQSCDLYEGLGSSRLVPSRKQRTSLILAKTAPNNLVASKLATNSSTINLSSKLKSSRSLNSGVSISSQSSSALRASSGQVKSIRSQEQMRLIKESKAAKTLAIVVGGFILSWLPFFIIYVLEAVVEPGTLSKPLIDAITWLGYFNSAINPVIYAFYSKQFRSAFYRLTLGKCNYFKLNKNDAQNNSFYARNSQSNYFNSKNLSVYNRRPASSNFMHLNGS